jgi:hypothetical protein
LSETSALHVVGPLTLAITDLPGASPMSGTGPPVVPAGLPSGRPPRSS